MKSSHSNKRRYRRYFIALDCSGYIVDDGEKILLFDLCANKKSFYLKHHSSISFPSKRWKRISPAELALII